MNVDLINFGNVMNNFRLYDIPRMATVKNQRYFACTSRELSSEMRIRDRVKRAVQCRLEFLEPHREAIRRLTSFMLLPGNGRHSFSLLYRTVDSIWFAVGDKSADFSFYTKRITLAIIYINALIILYNRGFEESEKNINKNLYRISKIPKIKNRLLFIKENLPVFLKSF